MDLSFSLGIALLLWFTDGNGACLYPLFVNQRDHRPIRTDDTSLWRLFIFSLMFFLSLHFHCLCSFHPASDLLGEATGYFLVGMDRDDLLHHLSCFVKGHEAGQVHQMFVLAWRKLAWEEPQFFIEG